MWLEQRLQASSATGGRLGSDDGPARPAAARRRGQGDATVWHMLLAAAIAAGLVLLWLALLPLVT